jgi:hypothetical protein
MSAGFIPRFFYVSFPVESGRIRYCLRNNPQSMVGGIIMSDSYQLGSDIEWLKHTNDEMARLVKKRNGQLGRCRGLCFLLLLALGWVVYKFQLRFPLEELWNFKIG